MDIVKKNLVSIICGVVAILAAVAVFVWPLDDYYNELKGKVTQRAGVAGKITGLVNKQRNLPILTIDATAAEKLKQYPNAKIIDEGEKAQKRVADEAIAIYKAARTLNQKNHAILIKDSLPVPAAQNIALSFRRNLQLALDNLRLEELNAGVPPTAEEMNKRANLIWEALKGKIVYVNVNGQKQATNADIVKAEFDAAVAKLPKVMQEEMAKSYKMYADPAIVLVAPKDLPTNQAATPEKVWWAQVEYWISADVAAAIKAVNASNPQKDVTRSPIKNLLALAVTPAFFPNAPDQSGSAGFSGGGAFRRGDDGGGGGVDGAGGETPAGGGLPDPSLPIPETGAALTPTKRVSNNLYDVVHFTVALDIEADKIGTFLKTLTTDRFIAVLRMNFGSVDTKMMELNGYVYGPNPVVTLTLECEAIFMREWTVSYMPPRICQSMGIPDPTKKLP